MQNRKYTAWKKSRKFGDIYGGRRSARMADKIFARCHGLKPPGKGEETPILVEENPSRDFFFPITIQEALQTIQALPVEHYQDITHIWFRRIKPQEYRDEALPWAQFICGSGVHVIILYPWPKDMIQRFKKHKPSAKYLNECRKFGAMIEKAQQELLIHWRLSDLRKFYVESLILHEVGHHIDGWYRYWTPANVKTQEEFANQYAIHMSAVKTDIFQRILNAESDPQSANQ